MIKVTELSLVFSEHVGIDVLHELSDEVHVTDDGLAFALEFPNGGTASMFLRTLADWLVEHGLDESVEVVNLDIR